MVACSRIDKDRMKPSHVFALALALTTLAGVVSADDRSLYWRALDVAAHLDADGQLHVRERHAMVFDGAWNGGERRFRLLGNQRLTLERISRIDSAGQAHPLRAGNLSHVDEYAWADARTLRWRSR